jgi:hypothetical protein
MKSTTFSCLLFDNKWRLECKLSSLSIEEDWINRGSKFEVSSEKVG